MATCPLNVLVVSLLFRFKGFYAHHPAVNLVSAYANSSVEIPLNRACKFGSLRLLKRIWVSTNCLRVTKDSPWSVRKMFLTEKMYKSFQFSTALKAAISAKNEEMVLWLFEHFGHRPGRYVDQYTVKAAAAWGNLNVLELFLWDGGDDMDWDDRDAEAAAAAGHSDVVKWLYTETSADRDDRETMSAAVASGDIELVTWLEKKLNMTVEGGVHEAAGNGHLEMLQWMFKRGVMKSWEAGVLVNAARHGQMHIVQWINASGWLKRGPGGRHGFGTRESGEISRGIEKSFLVATPSAVIQSWQLLGMDIWPLCGG